MLTLKLRIMARAFEIRMRNGESFDDIAKTYPKLTAEDLATIRGEVMGRDEPTVIPEMNDTIPDKVVNPTPEEKVPTVPEKEAPAKETAKKK